ncbi:MAG: hypothetical protein A2W91_02960 [Bacteroidetes bacterium GWF2_38_335]|nr:MAG: hypothetical protein A2W91_02960 [Bacteroidetes bacterium GWF2_38_335]OFY77550.1 MAG: hypothetical protein A2281_01800 [Bacteroidetes bacterium RIFOXYA12_FULL_38_20]HBS87153.1 hypothetical protein [Bacteroidales bacterium]
MKKILFLLISLPVILINSCRTDFDVNAEWEDISVVYCLLNPKDSVHYVKVNKVFLGEMDAYEMAKYSDSVNYEEATVVLEFYKDGMLEGSYQFVKTTDIVKEDGIFSTENNIIYKYSGMISSDGNYVLRINIPGKEEITAETNMISSLTVLNPQPGKRVNFAKYETPFITKWKSSKNARLYEIAIYFKYYEIKDGGTPVLKTIKWVQPSEQSKTAAGDEDMQQVINGQSFFNFVFATISAEEGYNDPSIKRVIKRKTFTFEFVLGGEDLNTFIEVNRPSNGIVQEKPAFTNINNGIGVFSCRFNHSLVGLETFTGTIDSLHAGVITGGLNFMSEAETTVFWGNNPSLD